MSANQRPAANAAQTPGALQRIGGTGRSNAVVPALEKWVGGLCSWFGSRIPHVTERILVRWRWLPWERRAGRQHLRAPRRTAGGYGDGA